MTIDYDTWKTTDTDAENYIEDCPICSACDDEECEHSQEEMEDFYEDMKTDYLIDQQEQRESEEDLNAEINW